MLTTLNVFLLFIISFFPNKELTITINLKDVTDGVVIYLDADNNLDSGVITNGSVKFKVLKTSITPLQIKIYNKTLTFKSGLYLDNSDVLITGSFLNFKELKYTGSKTQDETLLYMSIVEPLKLQLRDLRSKRMDKSIIDSMNNVIHNKEVDFINNHKDSYVSLYLPFISFQNRVISSANAIRLLELLEQNPYKDERIKLIDIIKRTVILKNGDVAPAFKMNDVVNNRIVSLDDLKNKTIIINFWASWCGPCISEMPILKEFVTSIKNNSEIVFLSVSVDDHKPSLDNALSKYKISFPVLTDYKGMSSEIVLKYGVSTLPETFVISKKGIISRIDITSVNTLINYVNRLSHD